VCQEVANFSDPLPEAILSILYKETQAGDDMLALKMDETYRGGGRYLCRLIEHRTTGGANRGHKRPISSRQMGPPPMSNFENSNRDTGQF
jgi:hypothetical protein